MGNRLHRLRRRLLILERFPRINNLIIGMMADTDTDVHDILATPILDVEFDEVVSAMLDVKAHNSPSYPYRVELNLDTDFDVDLKAANPEVSSVSFDLGGNAVSMMAMSICDLNLLGVPISRDIVDSIMRTSAKLGEGKAIALMWDEQGSIEMHMAVRSADTFHIVIDDVNVNLDFESNITPIQVKSCSIVMPLAVQLFCGEVSNTEIAMISDCHIVCNCENDIAAVFTSSSANIIDAKNLGNGTLTLAVNPTLVPTNGIDMDMENGLMTADMAVTLARIAYLPDHHASLLSDLGEDALCEMGYIFLK